MARFTAIMIAVVVYIVMAAVIAIVISIVFVFVVTAAVSMASYAQALSPKVANYLSVVFVKRALHRCRPNETKFGALGY
jgi:hypothetical protein